VPKTSAYIYIYTYTVFCWKSAAGSRQLYNLHCRNDIFEPIMIHCVEKKLISFPLSISHILHSYDIVRVYNNSNSSNNSEVFYSCPGESSTPKHCVNPITALKLKKSLWRDVIDECISAKRTMNGRVTNLICAGAYRMTNKTRFGYQNQGADDDVFTVHLVHVDRESKTAAGRVLLLYYYILYISLFILYFYIILTI